MFNFVICYFGSRCFFFVAFSNVYCVVQTWIYLFANTYTDRYITWVKSHLSPESLCEFSCWCVFRFILADYFCGRFFLAATHTHTHFNEMNAKPYIRYTDYEHVKCFLNGGESDSVISFYSSFKRNSTLSWLWFYVIHSMHLPYVETLCYLCACRFLHSVHLTILYIFINFNMILLERKTCLHEAILIASM